MPRRNCTRTQASTFSSGLITRLGSSASQSQINTASHHHRSPEDQPGSSSGTGAPRSRRCCRRPGDRSDPPSRYPHRCSSSYCRCDHRHPERTSRRRPWRPSECRAGSFVPTRARRPAVKLQSVFLISRSPYPPCTRRRPDRRFRCSHESRRLAGGLSPPPRS